MFIGYIKELVRTNRRSVMGTIQAEILFSLATRLNGLSSVRVEIDVSNILFHGSDPISGGVNHVPKIDFYSCFGSH